jgi:hypothetical protein
VKELNKESVDEWNKAKEKTYIERCEQPATTEENALDIIFDMELVVICRIYDLGLLSHSVLSFLLVETSGP